ncbi:MULTISPECIES: hypothetical protein [unclassified Chitinophaga]|uniref:hypothetical protein n=1 Tax=unclassified Chitinophaga TaxID=2619133 RepID=UPI00117C4AB7|nr:MULTISPECIES: hypothetical protein [unclassified Chitinophaga]WPV64598.1 hypothetical protein QQL36_22610 [Chitinophaga sp. LS1]
MKKIIYGFSILSLLSISILSDAQDKKPTKTGGKSFIAVTGGLSTVGGNYAKGDYYNSQSGFAKTGFNLGITGACFFKNSNWGIGGHFFYTHYGFNNSQGMAEGYKEDFDIDSSTVYIKGQNQNLNFLIGPYYNFSFGKLSLDIHALAGLTHATLPGNEVYLEDGIGNQLIQKKSTASVLGLEGGFNLKYAITQHFGVLIGANYNYAKPNFKVVNENRNVNAGRKIDKYNEAIAGIQGNIGVFYSL